MIKKISLLLLLVLTMTTLVGCGKPKDLTVAVDGDRTIGARKGQVLIIELEANATTGYIWNLSSQLEEGSMLRQLGKYRYIHKARMIGAGGIQRYKFEAVKKGKQKLIFEYIRPWEKDSEPAKKYVVKVIVT